MSKEYFASLIGLYYKNNGAVSGVEIDFPLIRSLYHPRTDITEPQISSFHGKLCIATAIHSLAFWYTCCHSLSLSLTVLCAIATQPDSLFRSSNEDSQGLLSYQKIIEYICTVRRPFIQVVYILMRVLGYFDNVLPQSVHHLHHIY